MPQLPSSTSSPTGRHGQLGRRRLWRYLVAALALLAIAAGVRWLESLSDGVVVQTQRLGSTPVTVFRPVAGAEHAPVVLIAHGFAGSQQLMQPFALTLARNGFVAVTFDFPGHGRNPAPMRGGLSDQDASLRTLMASIAEMGGFARGLAGASGPDAGRYALIGHSMASDIVVRQAQADPSVQACVGVSLFAPSIGADTRGDSPRNLLVVSGALEPQMMANEALRVIGRVAGTGAKRDITYGRFADGTARRATLAPGVEHIGVLYSAHTQADTLAWLNAAFGRTTAPRPFIDARGPALGLLLLGVVALAWSLSALLPRPAVAGPLATMADGTDGTDGADAANLANPTRPASLRRSWWAWRGQVLVTVVPALMTPLLLWKLPSNVLPILLGDYLLLHFALYGLLTLGGLWLLGLRPLRPGCREAATLAVAMLLACAYALLAVGVPVDRYVFNMRPEVVRVPIILALCAGTLPYFVADEWLTRGRRAARGAYVASKLAFLVSLLIAIALNPQRLFFLAIIVPAILLLFVIYGFFSRWAYARTASPMVAAFANALVFAWFIALTFPLVA